MKTKTFLLLCLFLVIGLTQLFAQIPPLPPPPDNKTGNGAVTYSYTWDAYWQPIDCDGFEDNLIGIVSCRNVLFYKNGMPIRANTHIYGTVKSPKTNEEFKLNEKDKGEYIGLEQSMVYWHFNLIGNLGTHYIGAMTWNCLTGEMWFDKLICISK